MDDWRIPALGVLALSIMAEIARASIVTWRRGFRIRFLFELTAWFAVEAWLIAIWLKLWMQHR
jgi:hypothetical protein